MFQEMQCFPGTSIFLVRLLLTPHIGIFAVQDHLSRAASLAGNGPRYQTVLCLIKESVKSPQLHIAPSCDITVNIFQFRLLSGEKSMSIIGSFFFREQCFFRASRSAERVESVQLLGGANFSAPFA